MNRLLLPPLLLPLFLGLFLVGCQDAPEVDDLELSEEAADLETADGLVVVDGEEYASFGDPLLVDGDADLVALDPAALTQDLGTYQNTVVRVEGTVAKVCQMKGCWLTLQNPAGTPIRVEVPRDEDGEYVYTFPKDLGIAEVIVEGTVMADETDVETLRHFAEDEGQSPEEIDAITEPERTVVLTARGALVKQADVGVQS
jgi:hypothetical protein